MTFYCHQYYCYYDHYYDHYFCYYDHYDDHHYDHHYCYYWLEAQRLMAAIAKDMLVLCHGCSKPGHGDWEEFLGLEMDFLEATDPKWDTHPIIYIYM